MSLYQRKDRMFYKGDVIRDDEVLRKAEYVYVDGDPEPHRPKHASWIRNRGYFQVKCLLERGAISMAVRNPEYTPRVPYVINSVYNILRNHRGELTTNDVEELCDYIEKYYPALKPKEPKK